MTPSSMIGAASAEVVEAVFEGFAAGSMPPPPPVGGVGYRVG